MSTFHADRAILRDLAQKYAAIAALPVQQQNIRKWQDVYGLKSGAVPTISIDQICWNELENQEELLLRCEDPFARSLENSLRRTLYRWKHFPCDMVVQPYFSLGKIISNSGYGISRKNQDETGHENAQTHLYQDNLPDEASLSKLHLPEIHYNKEASEKNKAAAEEYFGDILPVRLSGTLLWLAIWDFIVFHRGAEVVLYDLADRPEYLHDLMAKMCEIYMSTIDQYEAENLFEAEGALCHCLETYTDELPKEGYSRDGIRAKDCWVSGAAQIFSEVSPRMHDEFEIEYLKPLYERFGLVNYGCCEPLHRKIDIIRKINNVRAISISPWADVDIAAEAMGKDYVMARKPNPAFVAFESMDEDAIRRQARETMEACKKNGTSLLFVLKDITTVKNEPARLDRWHDIMKDEISKIW